MGDFGAVRAELDLPTGFSPGVLAEADEAVAAARKLGDDRVDATDVAFVTIDPPGAEDLDQAVHVERTDGGFRVRYAIADLGAFVAPGGALDAETKSRGQTLYLPDGNVPLHPPSLSESAASLLPGEVRPVVLWTIDTDGDGEPRKVDVRRALARSVERFDYQTVQAAADHGELHPSLAALPEFGKLRHERAIDRGAIELQLPEQEISGSDGKWELALRPRSEADAWNAEISLLTGMCAADMMLSAGLGVLRTLPESDPQAIGWLRRSARALGIDWPEGETVAQVLARLDPAEPESLALYADSTRLLRGAGYTAFDGAAPEQTGHAGIGGPYTHVTAPIRRLVDRYAAEVCLAVSADREVPEWARSALADLPAVMEASDSRAGKVERACIDQVETWLLADRVGQRFDAIVLRAEDAWAEVLISDPAVLARCAGANLPEGEKIQITLVDVDVDQRKVSFERAHAD